MSRAHYKHGFRSSAVLLPGDDRAQYDALFAELADHFGPRDLTEHRVVREMTDAEWRLSRCREHMRSALARHMETVAREHPGLNPTDLQSRAIETLAVTGCSYVTWLRYESKFEHQYDRAYRNWTRYQHESRRATAKETDIALETAIAAPVIADVQVVAAQPHTASTPLPQTPRSAPCPCGSGEKFKRCCGKSAPPVLHHQLTQAA